MLRRIPFGSATALWLMIGFITVFGALSPDIFLTGVTFRLVISEGVVIALLALAFLIPMAAGVFDLSVAAMLSMALFITNWIGFNTSLNGSLGALAAVAACGAVGAVSGLLIVKLNVNSLIATLGMSQVVTALTLYMSGAKQITGAFSDSYKAVARDEVFGIPWLFVYLLVIAGVAWYVMERTPVGRYIYATGGNYEAARLAGVPTKTVVWASLVASACVAGIAGVVYSMKIGTFSTTVGPGFLFPAISAVFFGASQFSRRPNVWGTLVALYALAFGVKGLQVLFETGGYWIEPAFQGVALVAAVALASRRGQVKA